MKKTILEISKRSGCSPATVSNVLNRKRGFSKATEEKVLKIAKEIGYRTQAKMESVRLVSYSKSGDVLADTPFFSALIQWIEYECRNNGIHMTVTNLSQEDPDFQEVLTHILNDSTSGILLLATELADSDIAPFHEAAAPVILLDSWFDRNPMDTVLIGNTDAVCNAVEYFIQNGHTQIGYLGSSFRINNFEDRKAGLLRALDRHDLCLPESFCAFLSPTMEGSYRDMLAYLNCHATLPTAFFADNDNIAFGVMKALQERGHQIPDEISIIGFDDMPFCEVTSPPLTTIRVFKKEMGQEAVRRLLSKANASAGSPCMKIELCTEFVERSSVRNRSR